jgi:hypothetical protein
MAVGLGRFLADQPRWSVYWDKKHGLGGVAEDDPDSDLYAESRSFGWPSHAGR